MPDGSTGVIATPPPSAADFDRYLVAAQRPLMGFAMRLTRSLPEAQDLVQDTMVLALRNRHRFTDDSRGALRWLTQIMFNRHVSNRRLRRNHNHDSLADDAVVALLPSVPPTAETMLMLQDALAFAATLPAHMQLVLRLSLAEVPQTRMASIMGAPLGTTKSRIGRTYKRMREAMGQ